MKTSLLALVYLSLALAARGQGTTQLINRIVGALDAPVFYSFGTEAGAADGRFLAQLYGGPVGGTLLPAGEPLPFRTGVGQGYVNALGQDTTRAIPGVPDGGTAQVMLVAWPSALGNNYAEAKALGILGESAPVTIALGGNLMPPTALRGLQGFTITASNPEFVLNAMAAQAAGGSLPEPSAAVLLGVGALVTLAGRRRA